MPDTKKHQLAVVSAYKRKAAQQSLIMQTEKSVPPVDVRNVAADTALPYSIPQPGQNVNRENSTEANMEAYADRFKKVGVNDEGLSNSSLNEDEEKLTGLSKSKNEAASEAAKTAPEYKAEEKKSWKNAGRVFTNDGNSGIISLLDYKNAVIPKEKFTQYALNPQKDKNKAEAFQRALGYTTENADELIQQIFEKLPLYNAEEKGDKGYGMTYQVIMDIEGANGKTAKVLTAWIKDKSSGETRLITVHIDD